MWQGGRRQRPLRPAGNRKARGLGSRPGRAANLLGAWSWRSTLAGQEDRWPLPALFPRLSAHCHCGLCGRVGSRAHGAQVTGRKQRPFWGAGGGSISPVLAYRGPLTTAPPDTTPSTYRAPGETAHKCPRTQEPPLADPGGLLATKTQKIHKRLLRPSSAIRILQHDVKHLLFDGALQPPLVSRAHPESALFRSLPYHFLLICKSPEGKFPALFITVPARA